jgi:hypothetical protein
MARRTTKAESQAFVWLMIIGLPIAALMKVGESVGWGAIIITVLSIISLIILCTTIKTKGRRKKLMKKYNDAYLVDSIMQKKVWQGQTLDQLTDSLGIPADIDEKVLKTKTKEIWKYNHQSANRYGLRITLENGCVVGWDQKD